MKPAPFRYHDPSSLEEAVALLATLENARLLAGGQSLGPMLNLRLATPDHLIDLNRIEELAYIHDKGDHLAIGAMTRQREIEFCPLVAKTCPLLREAVRLVGHRQTRNRGTIGGSLCHLDPAAEIACACCALEVVLAIRGPRGERTLLFADFPAGYMTSALEPDEILTEIRVLKRGDAGTAFVEFSRRYGDFAIVSAAALVTFDKSGVVARCALALGGIGAAPLRVQEAETRLIGAAATPDLIQWASEACDMVEIVGDAYTSEAYRRRLAAVLSRRALVLACDRARSIGV